MALSEFFADLAQLDCIDWLLMEARYWRDTQQDGDRKRRRQAEFLIHQHLPWPLINTIGVANRQVEEQVQNLLRDAAHKPVVCRRADWYY